MDLRKKLEEILAKDYGITNEQQLEEAYERIDLTALAIFAPVERGDGNVA